MATLTGAGSVRVGFNALQYIASYGDLIAAFGTDASAGVSHYDHYGYVEGRQQLFSGLSYIATYDDLISAFGANAERGAQQYIEYGRAEGRATTAFSGLAYIASYDDLIAAFGANADAGAQHYIQFGHTEGRARATFDGLKYIAAYDDLIDAFGANADAGARHFIEYGHTEGRTASFLSEEYLASYQDLMAAFGDNADAGAQHYIEHGRAEHRAVTFDSQAYLNANADVLAAFGNDLEAAARHYIDYGRAEGREAFYFGQAHGVDNPPPPPPPPPPPVDSTASTPSLAVANAAGNEDSAIALSINPGLTDTDGSETLTVKVVGLPSGATLNHGTVQSDGSYVLSQSELANLTLTPAQNAFGDFDLTVTAISRESSNGATAASAPQTLQVSVAPVVDAPTIQITNPPSALSTASSIALNISVDLVNPASTEVLTEVRFSGLGAFHLNRGVATEDGSYLVPVSQLDGLALVPNDPAAVIPAGVFNIQVSASSVLGSTTATTTTSIGVTLTEDTSANLFNGLVNDGYVSGATVFLDANGNGVLDAGEVSAITRADGTFTLKLPSGLSAANAKLVMFGGTDISTGLDFAGTLTAPVGSTVVTPLTTLVQTIVDQQIANGQTADAGAAQVAVKNALGLGALSQDITTFDAFRSLTAGTDVAAAAAVQSAAVQVQSTITQITAAGGTNVAANLATAVSNGVVDLTSTTDIGSLASSSGLATGAGTLGEALVNVATAANTKIGGAATSGTGTDVLTNLSKAATVALGDTTNDIVSAKNGTQSASDLQNDNTGSTLDNKVIAQAPAATSVPTLGTIGNDTLDHSHDTTDVVLTLDGQAGDDVLIGGRLNDQLFGGAGRDVLIGGAGNDVLDGGSGTDQASYRDATGPITVALSAGTVTGDASVGTDTLRSIERVQGTNYADTFDATGFSRFAGVNRGDDQGSFNEFEGRGGDDTVTGNGNTRVSYQTAAAAVTVMLATASANGHADASTFLAGGADDAGIGHDIFLGGVNTQATGVNQVRGSAFNDTLIGSFNLNPTVQIFEGWGGDDYIDGQGGFDRVRYDNQSTGATGIQVNLGAGTVTGRDAVATSVIGTDTLRSIESVIGSNSNDIYDARTFTATSTNGGGDQGNFNEFEGIGGDDQILGNGNTRISYVRATAGVTVNIVTGVADSTSAIDGSNGGDTGGVGHDTFSGVNYLRGSNFNDVLIGSANGNGTTETFEGRGGDDFIDGAGGFDKVRYDNDDTGGNGINIQLAAGTVTGRDSVATSIVGTDTLRSIESVVGSYSADIYDATGFTGGTVPVGQTASVNNGGDQGTFNEFEGVGGDDTITGNGFTRISYQRALAGVTVDLAARTASGTDANDIAQVGHDTFFAGTVNNSSNSTANNTAGGISSVRGSDFNDTLLGSGANETFEGRAGNDTIDGRGGVDVVTYQNTAIGTSGIQINLAAGTVAARDSNDAVTVASVGSDTLRDIEQVTGTDSADVYDATGFGPNTNANFSSVLLNNAPTTANFFEGRGGDDTITGNGNTGIGYGSATAGVTVTFTSNQSGTAVGNASVGTDTFTGVNRLNLSNFDDTVVAKVAGSYSGGGGFDTLDYSTATAGINSPFVGSVQSFEHTIGSAFADQFASSSVSEAVDGGAGSDIFNVTGIYAANRIVDNGNGTFTTTSATDGTDTLTNIEVLHFVGATVNNVPTGSYRMLVNDADLSTVSLSNADAIVGTAGDNHLTMNASAAGHAIDLGAGSGDTFTFKATNAGLLSLTLANVEFLNSATNANDSIFLTSAQNGLTVDLGSGTDSLSLFSNGNVGSGTNVVTVLNTETVQAGNFDDTINLGLVAGVAQTVSVGGGVNVVNLVDADGTAGTAAVARSLALTGTTANGASFTLHGRAGDDDVTLTNSTFGAVVNLGGGSDTLHLGGASGNTVTVQNTETVFGTANSDNITLLAGTSPTTVTGGGGMDLLTAGSGDDLFRYTAISDSNVVGQNTSRDTITGFDALHDTLVFDHVPGITSIDYLGETGSAAFTPNVTHPGQAQAHLATFGGTQVLEIDVNGDGQVTAGIDMQIQIVALQNTLAQGNFLVLA